MYVDDCQLSYNDIKTMTSNVWDLVDVSFLRINHTLSKASVTPSKPTVTVHTVTTTQIKVTNFLKYCNVSLRDKTQIINLYDNLVTKAT